VELWLSSLQSHNDITVVSRTDEDECEVFKSLMGQEVHGYECLFCACVSPSTALPL